MNFAQEIEKLIHEYLMREGREPNILCIDRKFQIPFAWQCWSLLSDTGSLRRPVKEYLGLKVILINVSKWAKAEEKLFVARR